ncbi:helix-turn-helix transcriptional regulator [Microtetraspora sp. NBRC 13810]|uniref:helix-turn-helix transcriptional regulator n=1 Tax=Microtetraspora sp. NBRC 13810 TaxID=3030990 RepID=UPI002552866C|nr:helix-turn-helix transcriptional regulator [Microtetraspora sp. NBRC 13810]
MPERTVTLLAMIAVEGTGELRAVVPAAARLGVSLDDLAPAERAEVVRVVEGRLFVEQPLVPALAYGTASYSLRAEIHRALAAEGHGDGPWHRAAAALGPDEEVAAALEEVAERVQNAAVRADALCAAADLTPDVDTRATRLAAAARSAGEAGQPRRAAMLAPVPPDSAAGPDAVEEALSPVWRSLAEGDDDAARSAVRSVLTRVRSRQEYGGLPRALEAAAVTLVHAGRWEEAGRALSEGLDLAEEIGQGRQAARLRARLAWLAAARGDEAGCRTLAAAAAGYAGAHGTPEVAALARRALGLLHLGEGRYGDAAQALKPGEGGYGDVVRALEPGEEAETGPGRFVLGAEVGGPDLVEAAVRCGREDLARWALDRMGGPGRAERADLARCRGLLGQGSAAGEEYAAALRGHELLGRPYDRARSALVYGEWLRRAARRAEARERLTTALEIFETLGAVPWARRARRERDATCGVWTGMVAGLTRQEARVAELAAGGVANREIAERLNVGLRTVESHLYRAFQKLGVSSREELARRLREAGHGVDGPE